MEVSKNFEQYEDWFIEEDLSSLSLSIIQLESAATLFDDELVNGNSVSGNEVGAFQLREILSIICEYIFEKDIENNGDFPDKTINEYKNDSHAIQINFLKDNKIINNNNIIHKLNDIRHWANKMAHRRNHSDENEYLTKNQLITIINNISIILSYIKNMKQNVAFDSGIYYGRNQVNKRVYEDISENIKLEEDKGIKIKEVSLLNLLYDEMIWFKIPLYQRGYNWDEKELNDLIHDIERKSKDEIVGYHFFGNISLISEKEDNSKKDIKVIDGQQRITTTLILLRVIYNRLLELTNSKENIDENLRDFINQPLKLDRVDNEVTMNCIKNIWSDNIKFDEMQIKTEAWFAFSHFTKWLENKSENEIYNYLEALSKFIIGINWIKDVDEFDLFESLNAKGRMLSNFDIFKNYIYSLIDRDVEKEQERIITSYFENFIEKKFDILSKKKSKSAKDRFMQYFIEYILDEKVNKNSIFSPFKVALNKWITTKGNKTNDLLLDDFKNLLFELSRIVDATIFTLMGDISTWENDSVLKQFTKDAFYTILSPAYSQIVFHYFLTTDNIIYDTSTGRIKEVKDPKEMSDILRIIEVWRVRREVAYNSGSQTMGGMIGSFIKKFKQIDSDFVEKLKELINKEDGTLLIPSIEKFERYLREKEIPTASAAGIILYRINEKYGTNQMEFDYKILNIIEPVDSKRSEGWNLFIDSKGIKDRQSLTKIGNYVIHKETKDFVDFPKNNFSSLEESVTEDNISLNIYGNYDFESINSLSGNDIDWVIDKRSEQFAEFASDIFTF